MFEFLKKRKKYTIEHNANINYYSSQGFRYDSYIIYLLKPVVVMKEQWDHENPVREEIRLDKGTCIKAIPAGFFDGDYSPHENLLLFSEIEKNYWFDVNRPRTLNKPGSYYINKDFVKTYGVVCSPRLSLTIKNKSFTDSVTINTEKIIKRLTSNEDLYEIICMVIDIFENFDPLIVNQFATNIMDTLKNLIQLLESPYCHDNDLIFKTKIYIRDVYKTILSFGEFIIPFDTPLALIAEKELKIKIDAEERNRKYNEERKEYLKKQDNFFEKMRYRSELLEVFNEPIEEIPEKIARFNAKIEKRWSKT